MTFAATGASALFGTLAAILTRNGDGPAGVVSAAAMMFTSGTAVLNGLELTRMARWARHRKVRVSGLTGVILTGLFMTAAQGLLHRHPGIPDTGRPEMRQAATSPVIPAP